MSKKTLTQADLIMILAQELNEPRTKTKLILTSILDLMSEAMTQDGRLKLHNFGVFDIKYKKERQGRDFWGSQPVQITARNIVLFRPSLSLKHQVSLIKWKVL